MLNGNITKDLVDYIDGRTFQLTQSVSILSLFVDFQTGKGHGKKPTKEGSILPVSTLVAVFQLLYKLGSNILLPDRNFGDVRN